MKASDLSVHNEDGTLISIWCKCYSVKDIDNLISWLRLARTMIVDWETIKANDNPQS